MTESTEKVVWMKCTVCGYTEAVPEWVLDELALGKRGDGYVMAYPKCDEKMIEK